MVEEKHRITGGTSGRQNGTQGSGAYTGKEDDEAVVAVKGTATIFWWGVWRNEVSKGSSRKWIIKP